MRRIIAIGLLLALSACGVATQVGLEAEQAEQQIGQMNATADAAAKIKLEQAIRYYQAETGTFPATLDVLVPTYVPVLPKKSDGTSFKYDATTGAVSL